MVVRRYVGVVALGLVSACGLTTTGEVPSGLDAAQLGADTGAPTPDAGSGSHNPPDATVGTDGGGTNHDASPHADASKPPDGSDHADASDAGDGSDANDASTAGDAGVDAAESDAGIDAGHEDAASHDAGTDAPGAPDAGSADAGVDASPPPGGCFYDYSCGSTKCGCNQLCDDGTTCGACLPHFGTCTLDVHDCDTDFSSVLSCGGCGNICTCLNPFNVSCSKNASGDYVCGC